MGNKKIIKQQIVIVDSLSIQVLELEQKFIELEESCSTDCKVKKVRKAPKRVPQLSANEREKRDAKREALKRKAAKVTTEGKKITEANLKNIRLTYLYWVGPRIEEYLVANDIDDMFKLSNEDVTKFTEKFISELPALRSFTYKMKYDKLKMIIGEAQYTIKELT